jgi:hypothetical protein
LIIVFVYNADSGPFIGLKDMLHKVISPSTYACSLCAVTYSTFGMRKEWSQFIDELDHDVSFVHKDELRSRFGIEDAALPAVFRADGEGRITEWIDAASLNDIDTLDELKSLILERLEETDS